MCSPFTIDIRPRRLPAEIKQIAETVKDHGAYYKLNLLRCIDWIYMIARTLTSSRKTNTMLFHLVLGIRCIVNNDAYDSIEATIPGPKETPYEEMHFRISMDFDSHYPFRPPVVKFVTPVYHPNIDRGKCAYNF